MLIKKSCKCGRNPTIVNLVPSMPQLQVLSMTLLYSVHDKSDVSRGTMYVDVQLITSLLEKETHAPGLWLHGWVPLVCYWLGLESNTGWPGWSGATVRTQDGQQVPKSQRRPNYPSPRWEANCCSYEAPSLPSPTHPGSQDLLSFPPRHHRAPLRDARGAVENAA